MTDRIVLLFHPSRHAEVMNARFPEKFELQDISWRKFNDGWPDIKLQTNLIHCKVVFFNELREYRKHIGILE